MLAKYVLIEFLPACTHDRTHKRTLGGKSILKIAKECEDQNS